MRSGFEGAAMIRKELHRVDHMPDALSHPPPRPHFDAIAWKARRARADAEAAEAVAALLRKIDEARRMNPARERADAA